MIEWFHFTGIEPVKSGSADENDGRIYSMTAKLMPTIFIDMPDRFEGFGPESEIESFYLKHDDMTPGPLPDGVSSHVIF